MMVGSRGRLRWHVERKDKSDWLSTYRELQVEGTKSEGRQVERRETSV